MISRRKNQSQILPSELRGSRRSPHRQKSGLIQRDCLDASLLPMTRLQIPSWLLRCSKSLAGSSPTRPNRSCGWFRPDSAISFFSACRDGSRLLRSNQHHAFPARPLAWHDSVARASCRQLIETGLLSLAAPFLPEQRIRTIARLAPSVDSFTRDLAVHPAARGAGHAAPRALGNPDLA